MLSRAEGEYLARIYELGGEVGPKRMADVMKVSRPTAHEVLGRLVSKGLLRNVGGRYRLTDEGERRAESIVRAHRVMETMLFRAGVDLDRACQMATVLQSQVDEDVVERICEFLGYPRFCPHGKPIPEVSR